MNIPTPCITFDQPLWLKAVEIIKAKSLNIVCRLGSFHTMMNFMGSIGSMMKSSGLKEALETAYGPNAVTHMISGKAVSRALRGHCLVEAALVNKLMVAVLPCEWDEDEASAGELQNDHSTSSEVGDTGIPDKLDASEVEKIGDLFQAIEDKSLPVSNVANSEELGTVMDTQSRALPSVLCFYGIGPFSQVLSHILTILNRGVRGQPNEHSRI